MDVNTFLSFLSFLKDSKFIFGLFLFCLILILLPDSFLITLGLQKTVNQYRGYLGLACILTFIFGIFAIYPLIQKCINSRRKRKKILKRIDSLSREEQEILNECIKKKSTNHRAPCRRLSSNISCGKRNSFTCSYRTYNGTIFYNSRLCLGAFKEFKGFKIVVKLINSLKFNINKLT